MWKKRNPTVESPSILTTLSMGALSSFCGQIISFPFQLLRTRMQADTASKSKSMGQTFKHVLKNDGFLFSFFFFLLFPFFLLGILGLWKGIGVSFFLVLRT